jgi:hypothetical protein
MLRLCGPVAEKLKLKFDPEKALSLLHKMSKMVLFERT